MKYVTNHPTYGEIQLDWGFWTGKFKLAIGGRELKKVSKTGFELQLPDSEAPVSVQVFGNNFKGFGIMIGTQPIQISPPAKWYDIVLAIIPGAIWFVMIGGAIGGAFAGGWGVATLYLLLSRPHHQAQDPDWHWLYRVKRGALADLVRHSRCPFPGNRSGLNISTSYNKRPTRALAVYLY